jgi:hypothetical protein
MIHKWFSSRRDEPLDIPPLLYMDGKLIREIDGWYWSDGEKAGEIRDFNPALCYHYRIYTAKQAGSEIRWVIIPQHELLNNSHLRYFLDNWMELEKYQPAEKRYGAVQECQCYIPLEVYKSWAWNSIPSYSFSDRDYNAVRFKADSLPGKPMDWTGYEQYRKWHKLPAYFIPLQCA